MSNLVLVTLSLVLVHNVLQADVRRALRSLLCLFTETVIKYTNFILRIRPAGRLLAVSTSWGVPSLRLAYVSA